MLKKLAKRINKELQQAEDYCEQAFLVREKSSQTADLFVELSNDEIKHAEKLLAEGKRLIDTHRLHSYDKTAKTEDDAAWENKCKIIWEWEYRVAMDRAAEIKYKLSMYRGS